VLTTWIKLNYVYLAHKELPAQLELAAQGLLLWQLDALLDTTAQVVQSMINNFHAQEEHTLTQIRSLILLNVINAPVDTSALQAPTDLSSVQTATIVLQVLRITSITLVHLEHISLRED
jgi:hypothetical protein